MSPTLWWLALPVLLVPIWLHRQKREQLRAALLATAVFLPAADPHQRRVWRWHELLLLTVRCLLLLAAIAWLANVQIPWRKDSVLVVPGTDAGWLQRELAAAGMQAATRIDMPDRHALAWFAQHEREWGRGARIVVAGDVAMPAQRPQLRHAVTLLTRSAPATPVTRHVAIESAHREQWQRFFTAASTGAQRYVIDPAPAAQTELVIRDTPAAPPPSAARPPLWWIEASPPPTPQGTVPARGPSLGQRTPEQEPPARPGASAAAPLAIADAPLGRTWTIAPDSSTDPLKAQALLESWQRLHYGPTPYTAPPEQLTPDARAALAPSSDDATLRRSLLVLIAALFAAERILAHVSRRP